MKNSFRGGRKACHYQHGSFLPQMPRWKKGQRQTRTFHFRDYWHITVPNVWGGSLVYSRVKYPTWINLMLFQSNQVPNSTWCELEGLKRAITFCEDSHLQVVTLITDRHRQIAKWICEQMPNTTHYYDIWHVGKGKNVCNVFGGFHHFRRKHLLEYTWCSAFNFSTT